MIIIIADKGNKDIASIAFVLPKDISSLFFKKRPKTCSGIIKNTSQNINSVTSEVKADAAEMLTAGKNISGDMERLDNLTQFITQSMNEMAVGAVQMTNTVQKVNEMTQENKMSIKNLTNEVNKFKV